MYIDFWRMSDINEINPFIEEKNQKPQMKAYETKFKQL